MPNRRARYGQEDQVAVFVTPHRRRPLRSGALVDAVQRPGRMGGRHGVVLEGIRDSTAAEAVAAPGVEENAASGLAKKDLCIRNAP